MDWLAVFKHLLPDAAAWRIVIDKTLRRFFEGLTGLGTDSKAHFDNTFDTIDPQKTQCLSEWEQHFALPESGLSEQERRDRIDAAWKAQGGQDPRYIEDTLRAAGFDVYVHEWWVPSVAHPTGGAVNGDVTPVARNPFTYLWDGSAPAQFVGCGHDDAYCGGDDTFANSNDSPPGYPLVNKIDNVTVASIGAGHDDLYAGGDLSASGVSPIEYGRKQYVIPADATKYPYFLYIGGQTFPDMATVQGSRRDEFENLCLKICPTEQWIGVLTNYT